MKKNWLHISLIVFSSIVVWTIVTFSDNFYTNVYLPVRIHVQNPDYAINSVSEKFVIVGLQGEGWVLSSYYWGANKYFDYTVKEDKSEILVSTRELIKQEHIFTSSVNIMNITPELLKITLDKKLIKEVFVKPKFQISLDNNYGLIDEPKIEPIKITISGPASIVKKIDTVFTRKISVNHATDSVQINSKVNLPKYVSSNISDVIVEFDIQKIVDKQVVNVPIKIIGMSDKNKKLLIFPDKINVSIRGGIDIVGRINASDITAFISFKEALADTTASLIPHIRLPKGVELVTFTPDKIDYIIKK